jgi:hypothetical protein
MIIAHSRTLWVPNVPKTIIKTFPIIADDIGPLAFPALQWKRQRDIHWTIRFKPKFNLPGVE